MKHIALPQIWWNIRSSYWFIPTLLTIGGAALALVMVWVDRGLIASDRIDGLWWIYQGGADGARTVLSTVAGSVITVAGVVFSITIAALTLASQQFGPRLLRNFMRDRGNQITLGTFTATEIYCLLVLRTVRGDDGGDGGLVPHLSVTLGVVLALACIGVLIYFIHHIALLLQAPHIVGAVAREMMASIESLYPERVGDGIDEDEPPEGQIPANFDELAASVPSLKSGYVQAIETETLMRLARHRDLLIRVSRRPGQYVVQDQPLLRIWPPQACNEDLVSDLQEAFSLGSERTPTQDVEFSFRQLVEVAVRALSPGINDPFTANNCVDHLGAGLCRMADRRIPSRYRLDDDGRLRIIAEHTDFAGVTDTALDQIRQHARTDVAVTARLLESLHTVAQCTRLATRRRALLRHARMIHAQAMDTFTTDHDRESIENRFEAVVNALTERTGADIRADECAPPRPARLPDAASASSSRQAPE